MMFKTIVLLSLAAAVIANDGHDWGYTNGGTDWTGICATGKKQSPIDIKPEGLVITEKTKIELNFGSVPGLKMKHNGHALQVDDKAAGFTMFNGNKYNVAQFHFHAPSENTINGVNADAEMHIVHQKEGATGKNDLLVIGVLFRLGGTNAFLDEIGFKDGPKDANAEHIIAQNVDLRLNNLDSFMYHFDGSLTTPTCDETVSWFVRAQTAQISQAQLDYINSVFKSNAHFAGGKGNNRNTQPLNGRVISVVEATVPAAALANPYTQTTTTTTTAPAAPAHTASVAPVTPAPLITPVTDSTLPAKGTPGVAPLPTNCACHKPDQQVLTPACGCQ